MIDSANSGIRRWPALLLSLACTLLLAAAPAAGQTGPNICGPIANAYGPFDYRTQRDKLAVVERFHFMPQVEALIRTRGEQSAQWLGGNLDYTLRASPNHHRALVAMMRYGEREKLTQVSGADYPVECYFERALRFAPDDPVPRMLYAGYLARHGRSEQGEKQLELVGEQHKDSAFTLYNVGQVYLEMNKPEKALSYDHRAKALGWPRKELEEKLRALGKWKDPLFAPASAATSAASSATATR